MVFRGPQRMVGRAGWRVIALRGTTSALAAAAVAPVDGVGAKDVVGAGRKEDGFAVGRRGDRVMKVLKEEIG